MTQELKPCPNPWCEHDFGPKVCRRIAAAGHYVSCDDCGHGNEGMTLRDYFAAAALQVAWDARDKGYYEGDDADMAECAYQIADAMLTEREKRNG